MSTTCVRLGPPSGTIRDCAHLVMCLIERIGEPPPGVYFWPQREGRDCWMEMLCYEQTSGVAANYVQAAVLLARGDSWEV